MVFRHLLERLEAVERVGPVERLGSSLIGGIKRMPIRYRMKPAEGGRPGSGTAP